MSPQHHHDGDAEPGPFRADQIREGEPYELSNGHLIYRPPKDGQASGPNRLGASVVAWDPLVTQVAIDAGYSPEPGTLWAPDVAVGNVPDAPGWIKGTPDLAIEYVDAGQDEQKLLKKLRDLLRGGTKFVWVVRLAGPRHVEVYEPGKPMRIAAPGEHLQAPGVLKNPVLVEALYESDHAEQATLANLLQRRGYESLEEVLAKGREKGIEEGRIEEARSALRRVLARRNLVLRPEDSARIDACADIETLERWLEDASVALSTEKVLR